MGRVADCTEPRLYPAELRQRAENGKAGRDRLGEALGESAHLMTQHDSSDDSSDNSSDNSSDETTDGDGANINIRPVTTADTAAVRAFVGEIGTADRTFLDDQLLDPERVAAWSADPAATGLLAFGDDRVVGLGSLRPGTGWSAHVGLLRLVVDPAARGRGVGGDLTRGLLQAAAGRGVTKVVVEVMAANTKALGLFERLGFVAEATLRDHVRDAQGRHQDLVVLANWIDDRGLPLVSDTSDVAG